MRAFLLIFTVIALLVSLVPAQTLAAVSACDSVQLSQPVCDTPQSLPQRLSQLPDPCAATPALLPQAQTAPDPGPPARLARRSRAGTAGFGQPPDLPWKPPRLVA